MSILIEVLLIYLTMSAIIEGTPRKKERESSCEDGRRRRKAKCLIYDIK